MYKRRLGVYPVSTTKNHVKAGVFTPKKTCVLAYANRKIYLFLGCPPKIFWFACGKPCGNRNFYGII